MPTRLPQRANAKMPHLHWDGDVSRNYTPYNFQTLRDDVYMLGIDGTGYMIATTALAVPPWPSSRVTSLPTTYRSVRRPPSATRC